MNSLSHSASRRTNPSTRFMTAAALTVAMFSTGCSTFGAPPVGGFLSVIELVPGAFEGGQSLCVGRDGSSALCVPSPKPKLEVQDLRVNLRQPVEGVLPSHVLCRLKRNASQALLECVEIYTRLPN